MSLSMHQAAVPPFVRQLKALSNILKTAEGFADARRIAPEVLVGARLAPDMHPLSRQVQIASDGAKGGVARLAGREPPSFADVETTFPELQERVQKTIAFLESVPASELEGSEDRTIVLTLAGQEMRFPGHFYLFQFVTPNFYFHVTTAYAILRHNGVEIGKRDFLGGV